MDTVKDPQTMLAPVAKPQELVAGSVPAQVFV
jgi:hypothetical protein